MSCLARWGRTTAAASVPATTTVWCSRAETILGGPGGVPPAPAGFEPGVSPCLVRSLQLDWGGVWGEPLAPDTALGLVDGSGQVRVETSEHAQRRGVLVRGADGSQGLWHGPGRASDDGRVLRVGLGAARCQVGDASHGQSGQVVHGDAHVLSHRHRQGPDGGRLIDHHQHLPLCLQALVDLTQPVLVVGQGPLEDLPPLPAQGRGPVIRLADARYR